MSGILFLPAELNQSADDTEVGLRTGRCQGTRLTAIVATRLVLLLVGHITWTSGRNSHQINWEVLVG